MPSLRQPSLEQRVVTAAQALIDLDKPVSPLDVLCAIGWVTQHHVDRWRQGRTDQLEPLSAIRPEKLETVLAVLRRWAQDQGLAPNETAYVTATRDRRALRFTADTDAAVERTLRTHWISPELSDPARERLVERRNRPPELLVIEPLKDWTCVGCAGTGALLVMEDAGPLCLTCADLDTLGFLPSGHATLTRRAKKESGLSAVVVRWSRSRKRYERQGVLVEEAALARAEASCLADEEVRLRRRERDRARREQQDVELARGMAEVILRRFPGCPAERAEAIATHTAVRGSGRVGRSAAGRALEEEVVARAVVASVRHEDTGYDELLMTGVTRDEARHRVRDEVDALLAAWRSGPGPATDRAPVAVPEVR